MANRYEKNLEDATNEVARSKSLQDDVISWKTSQSNIVSPALFILLDKYWLISDDLPKIWKTIKKRTAKAEAKAKPEKDETVVLQSRYDTLPTLEIGISNKINTTGIWKKVSHGEHVFAVMWVGTSKDSNNRGIGVLSVAFATGGGTYGGGFPIYEYDPVKYDEYYEMWRTGGREGRTGSKSPGAMVHRVLSKRNYRLTELGLPMEEVV